jgi:hypothetical protein
MIKRMTAYGLASVAAAFLLQLSFGNEAYSAPAGDAGKTMSQIYREREGKRDFQSSSDQDVRQSLVCRSGYVPVTSSDLCRPHPDRCIGGAGHGLHVIDSIKKAYDPKDIKHILISHGHMIIGAVSTACVN